MVLGAQARRRLPRPVSVLSESDKRFKPGPIDPGNALRSELTDSERRKLAKVEYARPSELIKQIGYRHEIYNALECIVKQPALKEHEIVQRALHLADPKATLVQKAEAMVTCADDRLLSHGYEGSVLSAWEIAAKAKPAVDHWWDSIAQEREEFRDAVIDVHASSKRAIRTKYSRWIGAALKDIVVVPRLTWDGRCSRTELRVQSKSVRATCGFALMLLVDGHKPFQNLLRLCQECDRPFLGQSHRRGSRASVYCSEECRTFGAKKLTAKRVARLRERRAKEES
jgi:hypothetical protein